MKNNGCIHKKRVEVKEDKIVVHSTQGTRVIYDLTEENSAKIYQEVLEQYPTDIADYSFNYEKKDIFGNFCTGSISMIACCIVAGVSHDIPTTLLSTLLTLMTSARVNYLMKEKREENLALLHDMKDYIESRMTNDWALKRQTLLLPNEVMEESNKVKKLFKDDQFFKEMEKAK